ncbi:MAG TPA: alpha/beta hydrolase [Rhizomicrobium sp.]|jgi:pimeloyl-ACP methyl ester carboxylesterase
MPSRAPRPDWNMPPPRDIQVLGARVTYYEAGQGPVIVLLHGFSGSADFEWGRIYDALAETHRVIAVQHVGFAPSERPAIPYDNESMARYLGGFFEALGLSDFTLVGESFGGWAVTNYAARAEALGLPAIGRLVIVGGAVGQIKPPKPDARGFVSDEVAAEVDGYLQRAQIYDHDETRMAIMRESGLGKGDPDTAALRRIRVPTLLIWGDQDELIPLAVGEAAARVFPNARLAVLKDVGHIPSIETPLEFVQLLETFVAGGWPEGEL